MRVFQDLPGEAQVRVVYLHQQEGMTVQQAIATASVEHRLCLLEYPVQAREAHTAAVRLMMEHVNESIFIQWIYLTVLVQTLPPCQQDIGRQVLRMVSADPRDFKGVYQARRAAARLGNYSINRALDNINDYGCSFRRHDNDLRGLSHYDRRRPVSEPDPVDSPPGGMLGAADILRNEKVLEANTDAMGNALGAYTAVLNEWLTGICMAFAEADDPVLQKLAKFYASWSRGSHGMVETRQRQVLRYPFDRSSWNDPATSDPGAILLGAFFKCSLVSCGHPRVIRLGLIAEWESWVLKKPDVAAMYASDDLNHMQRAASAHLDGMRLALQREITALGARVTPGLRKALLTALKTGDLAEVGLLRFANNREISKWPLEVQCRLYTAARLDDAIASLDYLRVTTRNLAVSLDRFDPFMSVLEDMPRSMFKLCVRACRLSYPSWYLDMFQAYHHRAIGQLRDLVESCQNVRARTLMLQAFPKLGGNTDLQRVRDIAVAAQAGKSLIESAEMLLSQQQDIVKVTQRIRTLEEQHNAFIAQINIFRTEEILNYQAQDEGIDPDYIRGVVLSRIPCIAAHLDCLGRADFGDSLRNALFDDNTNGAVDIARAFWTASLQRPLQSTVSMLGDYMDEVVRDGMAFAEEDVVRVSRLLLRAVYYSYVDAPNTELAQARGLSRHCWVLGLLRAWLDWHVDVAGIIKKTVRLLVATQQDSAGLVHAWGPRHARLLETLCNEHRDWGIIEDFFVRNKQDVLSHGLKDSMFEHLHKLRLLRAATKVYLESSDSIDPQMLPEDFRATEAVRGIRRDEGLDMLYRIVKFDKPVLDGGEATIDSTGWEDAHEYQLREMGLGHLSRSNRAFQ